MKRVKFKILTQLNGWLVDCLIDVTSTATNYLRFNYGIVLLTSGCYIKSFIFISSSILRVVMLNDS